MGVSLSGGCAPRRANAVPGWRALFRAGDGSRLAIGLVLLAALLQLLIPSPVFAAGEQYYEDETAPDSVAEYDSSFEGLDEEVVKKPARSRRLRGLLADSPLFREATLTARARTYYLYGKLLSNDRREAWTYGGWVSYRSRELVNRLVLGGTLYTSQPIHASSDRGGTGLLRPRQRPLTVFGETYAEVRFAANHTLKLYRRTFELPYLNRQDIRMLPITHEGYTTQGTFGDEKDGPTLEYVAGYVSRIKSQSSDRFVSMGEQAAPIAAPKRGLWLSGFRYERGGFSAGAIDQLVPDVLNTFFAEVDHTWQRSDEVAIRSVLQFTDQRSVGDDLIIGDSFDTRLVAGYVAGSYQGIALTLGFSTTSQEARIRSPFGSKPSPLSLMINDFDRAGEDAWLVGLSWDFRRLGLEGFSAFVNYARGNDSQDEFNGQALRDRDELDITLDYRPKAGPFRGVWFRVRGVFINERGSGARSQNELRVIVNYDLPVL